MKILGLIAENYKRLRVVEITPKGNLVQVTGKNGQGKSSVLDAIWTGLVGKRATPEKPVRKGAAKASIQISLGSDRAELIVSRSINPDGSQTLTVEKGRGNRITSPQALLDELLGELSFDPLAFVTMKPKEQVELLRKVAKLDIDVDAMNAANAADFDERTIVNRYVNRLRSEISGLVAQPGLPAERIDEAAIMAEINSVGDRNKEIENKRAERARFGMDVELAKNAVVACEVRIGTQEAHIADLQKELAKAKDQLANYVNELKEDQRSLKLVSKRFSDTPEPAYLEVALLTAKLDEARTINREIDKRDRHDVVAKALKEQERKAAALTRAIDDRNEAKAAAVAAAKMPIDGLTFDDQAVLFNGVPIEQLGEAEQIQIGVKIAMAANPTLRVLRILHGEALDSDSMKLIADMAEANDYQLWIAQVDSSGKVGIVMEDGMVKANG